MSVIQAFIQNEITLNEARTRLGLSPDETFGGFYYYQLFEQPFEGKHIHAHETKDSDLEEWQAYADQLVAIQEAHQADFTKALESFFDQLREQLLAEWGQKSIETDTFNRERKRVVNLIYREKGKLAKLYERHVQEMAQESARHAQKKLHEYEVLHDESLEGVDEWMKQKSQEFANRTMEKYRKDAKQVFAQAKKEGWSEDQLRNEIDRMWGQVKGRAEMIAQTELNRLSNSATEWVFQRNGVEEKMWLTEGKACPFCQAMNGKIVRIGHAFQEEGDTIHAWDEEKEQMRQMTVRYSDVRTPPLHLRCQCSVIPVMKAYSKPTPGSGENPSPKVTGVHPNIANWPQPKVDPSLTKDWKEVLARLQAKDQQDLTTDDCMEAGKYILNEVEKRYQAKYHRANDVLKRMDELDQIAKQRKLTPAEQKEMLALFQERKSWDKAHPNQMLLNTRNEVLDEIRERGLAKDQTVNWDFSEKVTDEFKRKIMDSFGQAQKQYPRDWWNRASTHYVQVHQDFDENPKGGYYQHGSSGSVLSVGDEADVIEVLTHEIMHLLARTNPRIFDLEKEYYQRRTKEKDLELMTDIWKRHGATLDKDEEDIWNQQKGRDGNFGHVYMSMDYGTGMHEILTTAMESFFLLNPDVKSPHKLPDDESLQFAAGIFALIK